MQPDSSFSVELYFAARNLKNLDYFSKSDPYLKLSTKTSPQAAFQEIGRTETFTNNINPEWKTKIHVEYIFSMKQPVLIEVFDEDSQTHSDLIGKVETTMGEIMGAHNQSTILQIKDEKEQKTGSVLIRGEKIEQSSYEINMEWSGGKIANVDGYVRFWDKSDPYLKFLKIRKDNTYIEVGRTEVSFNNLEPKWEPITFQVERLVTMTDPVKSFKIQCWDHQKKQENHKFIGQAFINIDKIIKGQNPAEFQLVNSQMKNPGVLILQNCKLKATPTFIDYLKSGLDLQMIAAIDFTGNCTFIPGSNKDPEVEDSLHNVEHPPNQYQRVLKSIWEIIQHYDSDKWIPSFGFGAKPQFPNLNDPNVSHCFPINGSFQYPQINGFGNLMNFYVQALKHMTFSGPTHFAPLLEKSFSVASNLKNSFSYQVLVILTDGQIHDMQQTKEVIIKNSTLPMSIIIVGIGDENFDNMKILDGDKGLSTENGMQCARDIVQFVPFNKYEGNSDALAKQLLMQLPDQISKYFEMAGKEPEPLKAKSFEEMMPSVIHEK